MEGIDDLDRAILDELRRDGRMTNLELSRRVGLTPAPCLRRVRRLEERGVILGYRAVLDPRATGHGCEVIVEVDIDAMDDRTVADFESALADLEEVVELRRLLGSPDYLLRVAVPDIAAYERFVMLELGRIPALRRIVSHQTMKVVKGFS